MKSVLGALLILACLPALADPPAHDYQICAQARVCRMASDAELDELRGGFDVDTSGGRLRLGIGITRAVAVNDRFVAVSQLVIPDVGEAIPSGARTPEVLIVQNGPGNHIAPTAFRGASFPTIVQNTLDGQKLNTFTIVNAKVNALSVLNAIRMGDGLSRATAASGR